MENKINLVGLLKDCPSGMELNCTMYDNLYFDKVVEEYKYPIGCYTIYHGCRISVNFTEFGEFNNYGTAKCVIFPKDRTTWEGFQRPFKDGDILFVDGSDEEENKECQYIFIYNKYRKWQSYCYLSNGGFFRHEKAWLIDDEYQPRFATEEEKQKLFQAIKENGYKWNAETKTLETLVKPTFKVGDRIRSKKNCDNCRSSIVVEIKDDCFIIKTLDGLNNSYLTDKLSFSKQDEWELVPNKFDINSLVPFESNVLVRDSNVEKWRPATWGYYDKDSEYNYPYEVVGGHGFSMCIPYEGNSHLMGKTDDCDEFYKTW